MVSVPNQGFELILVEEKGCFGNSRQPSANFDSFVL